MEAKLKELVKKFEEYRTSSLKKITQLTNENESLKKQANEGFYSF